MDPTYFPLSWYDYAIAKLKSSADVTKKFVVFDIGAGNSVLQKPVLSLGGQWIGFDYKPRREDVLPLNLEKPLNAFPSNERPTVIFLLEVIEHLHNPGQAMENIASVADPGTVLIISSPNPFWSVVRLKFLFLNQFPMFEKSDMDNNHHVFTAWPHVVEKLLTENNFQLKEFSTIGHCAKFPDLQLTFRYPAMVISFLLRKVIERFSPLSKGMSYGMVAIKQ